MLIFALHIKTDRKLTVVNKMTRNLFLWQPRGIDYQISKEKKFNIDKTITKRYLLVQTEITFLPTLYFTSLGILPFGIARDKDPPCALLFVTWNLLNIFFDIEIKIM